ncbi:MAG: hypothetical protein EA391_12010 [Balneolaceae bacterium]|nr:MAG: hypothetical protein EA391_12010 [Balneolaceae bacterium]
MKIKLVPRNSVKISRRSRSKYDHLKSAMSKLVPNGDAIRVEYSNQKELNSIRNIAYTLNKETGKRIKSTTDSNELSVFFFL